MNLPNSLHMTILGQTNYMSNDEKTALHISKQNMDYAAKEFYGNHKYISSVLVQVPEKGGTIRFGIETIVRRKLAQENMKTMNGRYSMTSDCYMPARPRMAT